MSNGGSERKLIGKWRLDFVANAGDPSLSAFPGTPSNHIQQPPECLLMAHRDRSHSLRTGGIGHRIKVVPVWRINDISLTLPIIDDLLASDGSSLPAALVCRRID
jgi:hypothetical protein